MNIASILIFAGMTLAISVTSGFLLLRAKEEGLPDAPSICAVAASWTIASALVPPLRGLVISIDAIASFWIAAPASAIYLAVMLLLLAVPKFVAASCPWLADPPTGIESWLTFITRLTVAVLLMIALVAVLVIFGQWLIEMSKEVLAFSVLRPEAPVVSGTSILYKAAQNALDAFLVTPGQVFWDIGNVSGLPFSILTLTICFTVNMAVALADQQPVGDEDGET